MLKPKYQQETRLTWEVSRQKWWNYSAHLCCMDMWHSK